MPSRTATQHRERREYRSLPLIKVPLFRVFVIIIGIFLAVAILSVSLHWMSFIQDSDMHFHLILSGVMIVLFLLLASVVAWVQAGRLLVTDAQGVRYQGRLRSWQVAWSEIDSILLKDSYLKLFHSNVANGHSKRIVPLSLEGMDDFYRDLLDYEFLQIQRWVESSGQDLVNLPYTSKWGIGPIAAIAAAMMIGVWFWYQLAGLPFAKALVYEIGLLFALAWSFYESRCCYEIDEESISITRPFRGKRVVRRDEIERIEVAVGGWLNPEGRLTLTLSDGREEMVPGDQTDWMPVYYLLRRE